MHKHHLLFIDLKLFDGTADGSSVAEATEGTAGNESTTKAENSGSSHRKSGEFEQVVFGKQEDAPKCEDDHSDAGSNDIKSADQSGNVTLEERRKAFEALIANEYKDVYTEKFQNAFNRRFKETKTLEEHLNRQKPIMDILAQRYSVADGDTEAVLQALENDTAFWEEVAQAEGMTVDQYKAVKKLERECQALRTAQERRFGEEQALKQIRQWSSEAEQLKEVYPTFDLQAETTNRDFLGLLKAGLSVKNAYELIHMEEIKADAARAAAQTAGQQMAARVREKAARPKENGISSQGAVIVKNDVGNLTRAERAEVVRRVLRGEKIQF